MALILRMVRLLALASIYLLLLNIVSGKYDDHTAYSICTNCFPYTVGSVWITLVNSQKTQQTCCKLSMLPACCNLSMHVAPCLSISSNCNKSVKVRLVATCHLQTCYNLLKQVPTRLLK